MAVTFVAASTVAAVAANPPTVNLTLPALNGLDIIIIDISSNNIVEASNEIDTPSGYTEFGTKHEVDGSAAADDRRQGTFWKRAVAADSGATVTISRQGTDTTLLAGVASVWRGAVREGSPFDATTATNASNSATGDIISFPAYDPVATDVHVVYTGWKADDATTALADFTNDSTTFTIRNDQEGTTGNDFTYGLWSANRTGAPLSAINATATGTDGACLGKAFALIPFVNSSVTVTTTIGSSGTYSTPQLWEDGSSADLTTAEKSAAGTFAVAALQRGETLTWTTGGATAKLLETDSTGAGNGTYITYGIISGTPGAGTVTGGTSTGTCVSTYADPLNTGVIWRGECQNQEFSGAGTQLTVSGSTSASTAYKECTTVAGASFRDHANKLTNALRYDSANGCGIRVTGSDSEVVSMNESNARLSSIQCQAPTINSKALNISGADPLVEFCLCEGTDIAQGAVLAQGSGILRNTVIIQRGSAAASILRGGIGVGFVYNCTLVASDDLATAPTAVLECSAGGTITVQNCGLFAGDSTKAVTAGSATFNFTTCYSDISGTSGVTQTTYGNEFQNVNDATRDFRLKTGAAQIDTGTTDATNAPVDIVGTTRPKQAAYDVGAWEFQALGSSMFLTLGVGR